MREKIYIHNKIEDSVWEKTKIDHECNNRVGWINAICVKVGNSTQNYLGCELGVDASFVFDNPEMFDYSHENNF